MKDEFDIELTNRAVPSHKKGSEIYDLPHPSN